MRQNYHYTFFITATSYCIIALLLLKNYGSWSSFYKNKYSSYVEIKQNKTKQNTVIERSP